MWALSERYYSAHVLDKATEIQDLRWRPAVVTLQLVPFVSPDADPVAPAHRAFIPAPGQALLSPRATDKPMIYTLGWCIRGQTG